LAELYVQGVQVDWQGYDQGYQRRKVPLPTYPFQRQRFWVEPEAYGSAGETDTHVATAHPLLGDRLSSALLRKGEALFQTQLSADSPGYLADHRLFDTVVPPATVYYEMALAAGSELLQTAQLALENLEVHQPLLLTGPEPRTLQCLVRPNSGERGTGLTFEVLSLSPDDDGWILHASGGITPNVDAGPPALDTTDDGPSTQLTGASCYDRFRAQGLDLGPSFQALQALETANTIARGRAVLPSELQQSAKSHHIHPVLLDACGQAASLTYPEGDEEHLYLPVGVERIELLKPGCSSGLVRVRTRSDAEASFRSADVELVDDDGTVVARVIGATTRRAEKDAVMRALRPASGDALYVRDWRPTSLDSNRPPQRASEPATWLLVGGGALGRELSQQLETRGQRGLVMDVGSLEEALQDLKRRHADPDEASGRSGVVFLDGAAGPDQEHSPAALLDIVRTMVGATLDMPPRLYVVTTGAQYVAATDAERTAAEHPEMERALRAAPLWGLGATIALEHPELAPVRIDLGLDLEDAVGALVDELAPDTEDDQVAVRAGERYAARLTKPRGGGGGAPANEAPIHADATYLITGGLGALGFEVARWLSAQGARHLALVSRRAPDGDTLARISELEGSGASVIVLQADISNRSELDTALERLTEHPPLRGIVHAAGVLEDGVLMQLDEVQLQRVMLPKVAGTKNLHALTSQMPLDFFACFSSAASVIGSKGQGNYAAANAFMDSFAHYRRAIGLPAVSINWGPWADVGMAANLDDLGKRRMYQQGWDPISTDDGLDILGGLLCGEEAQVAVLPVRWDKFLAHNIPGAPPPFFDEFLVEPAVEGSRGRRSSEPAAAHADVAKQVMAAPTSARRGVLTGFLQKQIAEITLNDDLAAGDQDRSFAELGLDSLMQMELRNVINKGFGSNVPMADFVGSESVSDLSELLLRHLALADITSDASPGAEDDMMDMTF
ncbi:MAG: type I polyketide synthase, partial [Longimicrobiales bacterium]